MARTVLKVARKINRKPLKHAKQADVARDRFENIDGPIDTQHLLISTLLPPAVKAFLSQCSQEVDQLCGKRYQHDGDNHRWGLQNGSIILGNQHVALEVQRVRSRDGIEVPLETYKQFQDPKLFKQAVFTEGLKKVSQRDYAKGVQTIANSFGFTKSSVSRKWVNSTAKKIEELQTRSLKEMDIRAVFIDGKRFSKYGVVIALGVASDGRKFVLGIYQSDTENSTACLNLLGDLERRGLPESGLLFVVDGGRGLNKALNEKYRCDDKQKRRAIRVRCYVHKWRNLEAILGEASEKVSGLFWALRESKDTTEAKAISERLEMVLRDLNPSALTSYLEAKEDLIVVHNLKLPGSLKRFFTSTNAIESLNSLLEEDMRRVKNWKSPTHFQRWLATFCLQSEKKMRRVRGFNHLPGLWVILRRLTEQNEVDNLIAEDHVA